MAEKLLREKRAKNQNKLGLLSDGGNLYLKTTTTGKSWIFRYRSVASDGNRTGKLRDMGLDAYLDVSLEKARNRAATHREELSDGLDPIEKRRTDRAKRPAAIRIALTFDEAAKKTYKVKAPEFKNAKHSKQWIGSLERYASPIIGKVDVTDIETADVVKVLEPIWMTKTETATRVRQRIETVLDWATASGYRNNDEGRPRDNPARWQDNLKHALPRSDQDREARERRQGEPSSCATVAGSRRVHGRAARP